MDRFRYDAVMQALWAGDRSYPAHYYRRSLHEDIPAHIGFDPTYRMETRQAIVWFENQWQLSTIWGDATYSTNNQFRIWPSGVQPPFVEEPTHVEVGVLVPEPITLHEQTFELPSGPVTVPERTTTLWGDPLGYVDVPTYHRVAWLVMHLPTDIDIPEGEWEDALGFCDLLITAGLERTFDE